MRLLLTTPATILPGNSTRQRGTETAGSLVSRSRFWFPAEVFVPLLAISLGCSLLDCSAAANRPNIVIMLADDMGFGDVHALNSNSTIPTPHLDRLAAAGMTFADGHSPSAVCTPTRYGLLTGRYCWRSRLKRGVLNGYGEPLIEASRPNIASFMKAQGYQTAIVGKWHLGLGFAKDAQGEFDFSRPVDHGPHMLGFDYSYVIPASLDFPPYIYFDNGVPTSPTTLPQPAQKFPAYLRKGPRASDLVMENVLDDLLAKAVGFIKRSAANAEQPFMLYFPLTAPHKPVLPHERFRNQTKLGPYGDFIAQVDWTVGQVVKTIDDAGVADNTLIIYTSDNGSFMYRRDETTDHVEDETVQSYKSRHHTANHVFRGTKADIWEAGHHVPFFARWPARIKAGSICHQTICLTDIFATLAAIVEQPLPQDAAPDSFSLLPLMQGGDWATPRAPVIHHSASGMFSIRDGKWKLVLGNGSGGREVPRGKPFQKPYALFDMDQDISERSNVIDQHAELARRLEQKCLAIRDSGSSR